MKSYYIKDADKFEQRFNSGKATKDVLCEGFDSMTVSDGYHTMDELYDHRIQLYITLCKAAVGLLGVKFELNGGNLVCTEPTIWRSKLHADGSAYDGWFILGIFSEPGKQISYHLPMSRWEDTSFAFELEKAPEFDGHTSADVLNRLKLL